MPLVDFKITLSAYQLKLFRPEIAAAENIGDLRLKGCDIHFDDYEGVEAFRRKIHGCLIFATPSLRCSVRAVINKIDRAVAKLCSQGRQ